MATADDLERFVLAQDAGASYLNALAELREGRKQTHWMWFVFPQIRGLGSSLRAQEFGIASLDEAVAYLHHDVLGPRLRRCVSQLLELDEQDPVAIFGPVDAMKLRSCLTLFHRADPDEPGVVELLERLYGGDEDPTTLDLLGIG